MGRVSLCYSIEETGLGLGAGLVGLPRATGLPRGESPRAGESCIASSSRTSSAGGEAEVPSSRSLRGVSGPSASALESGWGRRWGDRGGEQVLDRAAGEIAPQPGVENDWVMKNGLRLRNTP